MKPDGNSIGKAKELNLDSVFASHKNLDEIVIKTLRENLKSGIEINAEVGVFAGKDLWDKFPDVIPVEAGGKEPARGWYYGVCPSHEGVRNECLQNVKALLERDLNGIWLDFIRYPTKWEEPEPYILDVCYCDRCLKKFSEYLGEPIEGNTLEDKVLLIDGSYYIEWIEFKTEMITSMVREVRKLIDDHNRNVQNDKKVKLGFFAIPWQDKEHSAGIKRIVAQDFGALSTLVDIYSPMLYHKMCGKEVSWIKEMVNYFWEVGKPQLPLIQTEPRESEIKVDEFKQALDFAGASPSTGVCVFFLEDLMKQPEKFDTVKEYFK
ncbi:hypothetical protein A3B64_04460 [candidate division WWE3 bacterium RIFCSPLOWO2_01_FULL_37_24]|nr:MAG: hypothetical protein A3B64_04460 [candidate division WWE3 bacterium RIFCSPLOWO2_01_FULL_37_24]HLB51723.1 beta-galactosidase [Patescibacteria group bacterium]